MPNLTAQAVHREPPWNADSVCTEGPEASVPPSRLKGCPHPQAACTDSHNERQACPAEGAASFQGGVSPVENKVQLFPAEVTHHNIYFLVLTYQSTCYSPYTSSGQHSDLHTKSFLTQRFRMVVEEIWGYLQQIGPKDVHMIFSTFILTF